MTKDDDWEHKIVIIKTGAGSGAEPLMNLTDEDIKYPAAKRLMKMLEKEYKYKYPGGTLTLQLHVRM